MAEPQKGIIQLKVMRVYHANPTSWKHIEICALEILKQSVVIYISILTSVMLPDTH